MSDFGTQIRDYLDLTAAPVETERVAHAPDGDRRSTRLVPGWAPAVASAVAILLAIGIPAAFFWRGDGGDVALESPAPATSIQTSTTVESAGIDSVSTTVAPLVITDGTWARHEVVVGAGDLVSTPLGLAAGGPGGVWFSDDGVAWVQRLELPTGQEKGQVEPWGRVDKLIVFGDRVVAVGTRTDVNELEEEIVAWTTADGIQWSEAVLHTSTMPAGVYVGALFADTAELILAGYEYSEAAEESEAPSGTSIWKSTDGETWAYTPIDETGLAGVSFTDMARLDDGYLTVAEDGSVWASGDGVAWSPVPGTAGALGGLYPRAGFADVAGELLVIGQPDIMTGGELAIWATTNGVSWEQVQANPDSFAQGVGVLDVSSGGYGLVVSGAADPGAEVWASVDGRDWMLIPDPDGLHNDVDIWQLAQAGNSIVAVGSGAVGVWTPAD